jgi:hypothetical protein
MPAKSKPCHNCRQRRLRCDASIPFCMKCTTAGRQCLGYGQLLRWNDSGSYRGKRKLRQPTEANQAAATQHWKEVKPVGSVLPCTPATELEDKYSTTNGSPNNLKSELQLYFPLLDSSVKDFSHTARYYLSHCEIPAPG